MSTHFYTYHTYVYKGPSITVNIFTNHSNYTLKTKQNLRPESIDLLFLGSFPDPFERVERDKK